MYIHGTRDRATQSKRKPSLNFESKKEKQKERVKSQIGLTLCCSPRFFRSLRGSAYSKDRCSFDSFDSLNCYWGLLNFVQHSLEVFLNIEDKMRQTYVVYKDKG